MTLLGGAGNGASATELIRFFSHTRDSGTLVLRRGPNSLYCLFEDGRVRMQRETAPFGPPTEPVDAFTWYSHDRNDLPWLASTAPDSLVAGLRALPRLGNASVLRNVATDLPDTLKLLREEEFHGAILQRNGAESGLAVLTAGAVRACAFERDGYVWQRVDALRALQRHSLEAGLPGLELIALDEATALSLAGLMLDRRARTDDVSAFDGVASDDSGYVFHLDGRPYLHVRSQPLVAGVRYAQPNELPDLHLPGGKPGWERETFDLTLRGRDALIPMTELAMEFEQQYGQQGRNLLSSLKKGMSPEDISAELQLDLADIREGLELLKEDGMIRVRK